MKPILSILICTIIERKKIFDLLLTELNRQIKPYGSRIEVLFESDNKQMSIGKKRQILLDKSIGKYIVYFDDDDWIYPDFVFRIMVALESSPDCVGIVIDMTTNLIKPQICCHSLKYPEWKERVDGYDYVRNVTHRNPVRRDLAIKIGFDDKRYGEDKKYSDLVTLLCKTEVFISTPIFRYQYDTHIPFKRKYGIS